MGMEDLGCAVISQGIVAMLEYGDLEYAVDYHVLSSYTDFQLQFEYLQSRYSIETKGRKQTTLHVLYTLAVSRQFSTKNRRHSS